MRGGTMEKRLRLGVFPNLPKEKVRALLPKLVEFCKAEEIPGGVPPGNRRKLRSTRL